MKKILNTLIISGVIVFSPFYASANNISATDFSAFENCNGDQTCELLKEEIIKIITGFIKRVD